MRRYRPSLALLVVALVAGCVTDPGYYGPEQSGLIQANYAAADALLFRAQNIDPAAPVLVPPAVNMDRPNDTSALGRVIAEQISARLTNRGIAVISSAEAGDRGQRPRWEAVVFVSYAVARGYVYVNVKLIREGNIVSSAYDYTLPLTRVVSGLLPGNQLRY